MSKFELRKWQKYAIKASKRDTKGIFLEAASGRGKTICALEICKDKKAKSILILNNKLSILKGWEESLTHYDLPNVTVISIQSLKNQIKKGKKYNVDILIVDEWQNMCSDANLDIYKKIKRNYTIGLSATPIRRKGTNFFGLEQTVYGKANPSNKWVWQSTWGKLVSDPWTMRGVKWEDFKDYPTYLKQLPNFIDYDKIERIENAQDNNGYELKFQKIYLDVANPKLLADFKCYNLVRVNGKSAMSKQTFGKNAFLRYLRQTHVDIDFPKLKVIDGDTPTIQLIENIINHTTIGTLIVTKSVQIAELLHKRNPTTSLWTGTKNIKNDSLVTIASQDVMGVGVDGLQSQFQLLIVLDPVEKDSGSYDDYRQLLWRVTGSRQQHDCMVIEIYYKD